MSATTVSFAEAPQTGFGLYKQSRSLVGRPEKLTALLEQWTSGDAPTVLARGAGLSYGDAAMNTGGLLVDTTRLNRMLAFDESTGVLHAESGVKVSDIMRWLAPRGYMPYVGPGYSGITLGGCLATDTHTKNHWKYGGFADYVIDFQLLLPNGNAVVCSRDENPELFHATTGGLGLTGLVTDMRLELRKIPSPWLRQTAHTAQTPEQTLDLFYRLGDSYDYMVAWVDALPGSGFGRSIVFGANPIPAAEAQGLPPYRHADAKLGSSLRLLAPFFNGVSIYALNALFYRVKKRERDTLIGIQPAWFPWDSIPQWNKLYAPRGFVEYQVMIPYDGALGTYTAILEEVRRNSSQHKVYFAALKRMRKSPAPLAFCLDGFSLLMDFGVRPGVWEALDRLDRIVADAGGRVFLAKDGRVSKEMFRNMYPEWRGWAELRAQLDPEGRIMSDMGRRLGLDLS